MASSKASPNGISAESVVVDSLFLFLLGNLNLRLEVEPVEDAGEVDPDLEFEGGGSRKMLLFSLLFSGGRSSTASSNTFKDKNGKKAN